VKIALREHPDLILMDLDLPGLDGTTVMHLLREHEELHDVPIVAVTAYDGSYPPADAFASGCSEYLTKPIEINQLENILSRFLHER
jgi:CheY-like chemotaxis protein